MKALKISTIEDIKDSNRWNNCAWFFCIDFNNTNNDVRVSIREFKIKLTLYQTFEIFVMLKMKTFERKKIQCWWNKFKKNKINIYCDINYHR